MAFKKMNYHTCFLMTKILRRISVHMPVSFQNDFHWLIYSGIISVIGMEHEMCISLKKLNPSYAIYALIAELTVFPFLVVATYLGEGNRDEDVLREYTYS